MGAHVTMSYIPTCTVSTLTSSTGTDIYGDPTDTTTVNQSGIGAHLWQTETLVYEPSDGRYTSVRQFKGLLPHGTLVEKGWRILDETTDEYFSVLNVNRPRNPVMDWPVHLDLELLNV